MPFSADVLSLRHFPSTEQAKLQDAKMTKRLVDLCRKVDSEAQLAKYVEHIIRIDIKGRDEPNSIYHAFIFVHKLTTPWSTDFSIDDLEDAKSKFGACFHSVGQQRVPIHHA